MVGPYDLTPGSTPLLVSLPHNGTHLPAELSAAMTPEAQAVPDTDWHMAKLYAFARDMGASVLAATHSRYCVDLNRDPAGNVLYPGQSNTELCPTATFAEEPIYRGGQNPDEAEMARRVDAYWQPYHSALEAELGRLREAHGVAVLLDGHSIRSRVPRFFEGTLPDLNLGSGGGVSADAGLIQRAFAHLGAADGFSAVLDGRFKGGYITRHYGRPAGNIHALQLEIAQSAYMDEDPPYAWSAARAARLQQVLRGLVALLQDWAVKRA